MSSLDISICAMTFSLFVTVQQPNSREMLVDFPGVELGSDEWMTMLPIGILALLCYTVRRVASVTYTVVAAPSQVVKNVGFLERADHIVGKQRPGAWWWALPELCFAVGLSLAMVLPPTVSGKLYVSLFLTLVYCIALFKVRPNEFSAGNTVEMALKLALLAFLILGTSCVDVDHLDNAQLEGMRTFYSSIGLTFFGAVTVLVIWRAMSWLRSRVLKVGFRRAPRLRTVHDFLDVSTLIQCMPNKHINGLALELPSTMIDELGAATSLLVAAFLKQQPGRHFHQQHLLPRVERVFWNPSESARVAAALENQRLASAVRSRNRRQVECLQQARGLFDTTSSARSSSKMEMVRTGSKRSSVAHIDADLFRDQNMVEVDRIVDWLSSTMGHVQVQQTIELLDPRGEGFVSREDFRTVLAGMTHPSDDCCSTERSLAHFIEMVNMPAMPTSAQECSDHLLEPSLGEIRDVTRPEMIDESVKDDVYERVFSM